MLFNFSILAQLIKKAPS